MFYNSELLPLIISIVFLSLVVLWIAVENRKKPILVLIIIPLTLIANVVSYFTVDKLLGFSVEGIIPDDSVYLHHVEGDKRVFLHVWVMDTNTLAPRAYKIPNTEGNRKSMDLAKEKTERGQPQELHREQGEQNDVKGKEKIEQHYVPYDFNLIEGPPPEKAQVTNSVPSSTTYIPPSDLPEGHQVYNDPYRNTMYNRAR